MPIRADRRVPAALLALLAVLAPAPALADGPSAPLGTGDGERGALERLIGEIDALEPLVAEAERQADRRDRSRFAYDWLRADLERMKRGIQDHLERPRNDPNAVSPLLGDSGR